MNLLAGQAEVGDDGGKKAVLVGNSFSALLVRANFAPRLRRVVLVGELALRKRLDLDGVRRLLAAAEDGSGARRAVALV